tara:strand:+ start:51 stop:1766 length:1716 start_codon:yes stop_codon:yes gene_type:complete
MMNVLQIQDDLKNFSEEQLVKEMQQPSGNAPQFLILSELNRRRRVKGEFAARQAQKAPTVAEEAVAAAGVPQAGMMGMSEAMAPASVDSGGIGSMMPKTMKMGGEVDSYAEGGVIKAQSGKFFDAMGRPTQELIDAMIMQESGGDTKARGSLDEVGLSQIRPSTAIMPGYGVKSMFPELESQIGKGKKYATAGEAYADNKEMVDARLEEGDTSKKFMEDLLTGYRKNTDTDAGAISAYNVGLGGLKNIKNPADFKYFTEVASKMNPVEFSEVPLESGIMSAQASTIDDKKRVDGRSGFDRFFNIIPTPDDSLSGLENMMETDPDKKFLFGEKGIDMLKKQAKDRIERRNNPDIKRVDSRTGTQKLFNIIPEPDDSLSGFETVYMGSPADATAKEKAETDAALTSAKKEAPDAPEEKTQLTTLEQELLNRQNQLQKDRDFDRYMALAQAGLSIMASDKPTLAGAIGEGGTAGLTAFREAQERYQDGLNDILNARVKLASKKGGLTQKDAISAISSIDSDIAKYRTEMAKAIDPANVKTIENAIAQLEFQKERLLPIAGFSRLSMNVSDSAAK